MTTKFIVSTMIDDTKMYLTRAVGSKTEIFFSCRKSKAKVFMDDALAWSEKGYDVEILPEDQVMRLVGAPQLPGMEDFFTPNPACTNKEPYSAFEQWCAANGYDTDDDEQLAAAIEAYGDNPTEMPPARVTA